jgi:hypothetical protein
VSRRKREIGRNEEGKEKRRERRRRRGGEIYMKLIFNSSIKKEKCFYFGGEREREKRER